MAHETHDTLRMTMWNCNGSLWTYPGRLQEIIEISDIIFLVETHQSSERGLPRVEGFLWESTFRKTSRQQRTRGSGGVALLFRKELQHRIQILTIDIEARYIWARILITSDQAIYVAICYFPPKGSRYNIIGEGTTQEHGMDHGPSPYDCLSDDIIRYSLLGEVFLIGDFNARTQSQQCTLFDIESTQRMVSVDPIENGTTRLSKDKGADATGFGHHLLELGSRHRMVIYNGMQRWPCSNGLTCFPHGGGESTVDYLIGRPEAAHMISSFKVGTCPIGADHCYLHFEIDCAPKVYHPIPLDLGHVTIHFTHELADIYSRHVQDCLPSIDLSSSLETITTQLTNTLHSAAMDSFPHTRHSHHTRIGSMPQNRWYDDECRDLYKKLRISQLTGLIGHREARKQMRKMTRYKKRVWEESQYWDLYHMLMSNDCARAWRRLQEPQSQTPIQDPSTWHTYAEKLYQVPDQPPIMTPYTPRPTMGTFFTTSMVIKAIKKLQNRKAADHTGLQAEHLVYAQDDLAPLITHLFNRALSEGFPPQWRMNTVAPIHKGGDSMDPNTYRTIMIGHILAKLYGTVMEAELSGYTERAGLRAPEQAGFRRAFSTIDHIFTLRCLIDLTRARKQRLYCCFVDFRKAFDTVPRDKLFARLQSLEVPDEMTWAIYALYERVSGRVRCPGGLSDNFDSTIGVKQGCPLSPTLFGIYIDEITEFIAQQGGSGVELGDTQIHIMLYADDIVLLSESEHGLQGHLNALDDFCIKKGLVVNLGKTKVLIFHTSSQVRSKCTLTLVGKKLEVVSSYVYLGVTFTARVGKFSMTQAAKDRLTKGYASLSLLERQCHQAHFQEPRTKAWLFDTIVTPSLMYVALVWTPGLPTHIWTQLERPLVMMLSRLIRSKSSVPHEVIRAEFALPPMLVEALFQIVVFIRRISNQSLDRLSRRAFDASRNLHNLGDRTSWYSHTISFLEEYGLDINKLPPLKYNKHGVRTLISHEAQNKVIRQEIWKIYIRHIWIQPREPLSPKMLYYKEHFMHFNDLGFIERPRYLDIFLPHALRIVIGQLRVSSHNLEIESGRAAGIIRESRICKLCRIEVECEEHFTCRCPSYTKIREEYKEFLGSTPSLSQLMNTLDPKKLGKYLLDLQRYREGKLINSNYFSSNTNTHSKQSLITCFFQNSRVTNVDNQQSSMDASTPGLSLTQAEKQRARRRPRVPGFKTTRCDTREIQKIRHRELLRLETKVQTFSTFGSKATSTPFGAPLLFERLGWK